jgi:hypothetical protein
MSTVAVLQAVRHPQPRHSSLGRKGAQADRSNYTGGAMPGLVKKSHRLTPAQSFLEMVLRPKVSQFSIGL